MTKEEREKARQEEKLRKESIQKALEGSIQKWQKIVTKDSDDMGADNCPLCRKFHPKFKRGLAPGADDCLGCPVREKTGLPRCEGTPYQDFRTHLREKHPRTFSRVQCDECKKLAEAMVVFLTSLKS